MAAPFSISVDVSDLVQAVTMTRAGMFNNLAGAVQRVAEAGVSRWQQAVFAAPLWEGEQKEYAASIRAHQTGPLSWEIVSDYRFVEDIENGRPPRDLKVMLNTSLKVRTSKKGVRYLIIPFRHGTPGNGAHARAMPQAIYDTAKHLDPSRIVGHGLRLSGTGAWDINTKQPATVRKRKYLWGGRLGAQPEHKLKTSHRSDPFAGMVRMDATPPGAKRYSQFLTFRVMSEASRGWVVPAKPGLGLAKAVAESLKRTAETEFGAAVAQDLRAT
jgi:hypothetical protein